MTKLLKINFETPRFGKHLSFLFLDVVTNILGQYDKFRVIMIPAPVHLLELRDENLHDIHSALDRICRYKHPANEKHVRRQNMYLQDVRLTVRSILTRFGYTRGAS